MPSSRLENCARPSESVTASPAGEPFASSRVTVAPGMGEYSVPSAHTVTETLPHGISSASAVNEGAALVRVTGVAASSEVAPL